MTAPRMCLPGTTYLVTRTCADRRFLLKPDRVVNELFGYCVARAQRGLDLEVHAVMVLSNHYHAVVTDRSGDDLSAFMHALNRLVACCLKQHYGELLPKRYLENVWARCPFNAVALLNPNAVRNAIAYTLTNPVKDCLLGDYRRWPGFHTKPRHWRQPARVFRRPSVFFSQSDDALETLPLQLTPPPMLLRDSDEEAVTQEVEDLVLSEQNRLAREQAAERKTTMGIQRVLRIDPFESPATPRPAGTLEPELACGGDGRLMREAKQLLRSFRRAYHQAFLNLVRGLDAVFPYGTLLQRLRFGVDVEPACAPPWCVPQG